MASVIVESRSPTACWWPICHAASSSSLIAEVADPGRRRRRAPGRRARRARALAVGRREALDDRDLAVGAGVDDESGEHGRCRRRATVVGDDDRLGDDRAGRHADDDRGDERRVQLGEDVGCGPADDVGQRRADRRRRNQIADPRSSWSRVAGREPVEVELVDRGCSARSPRPASATRRPRPARRRRRARSANGCGERRAASGENACIERNSTTGVGETRQRRRSAAAEQPAPAAAAGGACSASTSARTRSPTDSSGSPRPRRAARPPCRRRRSPARPASAG